MTDKAERYKPLLLLYLHMHPADVGRLTLRDLHMSAALADQLKDGASNGR